jgi:hypothetical protein
MALPASLLSTCVKDTSLNAKKLICQNRRRNYHGDKNHAVSKTETLLLVKDDLCIFSFLSDLLSHSLQPRSLSGIATVTTTHPLIFHTLEKQAGLSCQMALLPAHGHTYPQYLKLIKFDLSMFY